MVANSYCVYCLFLALNEKVKLLFIEHVRRVPVKKVRPVAHSSKDTNADGQGMMSGRHQSNFNKLITNLLRAAWRAGLGWAGRR